MLARLPLRVFQEAEIEEKIVWNGREIEGVNLWGVVTTVSHHEKYTRFVIDDFTGEVSVFVFGESDVERGDVVNVIGRAGVWKERPRVVARRVRRIDMWEELVRRLESAYYYSREVKEVGD